MRNIVKVSVAALGLMLGLSSCDSFFAEMPGIRYDIEMSFKDQVKTKAFWQMYIALFRLNQEKNIIGTESTMAVF